MTEKEKALMYRRLRERLETDFMFPSIYRFEFIIPVENTEEKITQIKQLFAPSVSASVQETEVGTSMLTIQTVMLSTLDIIRIYKEATKNEGVSSPQLI